MLFDAELCQSRGDVVVLLSVINGPKHAWGPKPVHEGKVVSYGQAVDQAYVLMKESQALPMRGLRSKGQGHVLASYFESASCVWLVDAGEYFDQG
ncbi:hypothetical protein StoSoilB20_18970 [Arthrobacter sp. StoSoilB20]|nr:hypothetical protein StoSoilB20_18970 [Arthrobacter sp. StoSoilB20]